MGAVTGHKVVVEMTSYGGEHMKPEGKVTQIIGHVNDPGTDILSIVMDLGIKTEFPEKVLNQAVRVGKPVSEADRAGRKDLTNVKMVTIDSEDAKDLDDAVSVERDGENYVLGVHIADVTNYVQEKAPSTEKRWNAEQASIWLTGLFRCFRTFCQTGSVRSMRGKSVLLCPVS